MNATNKQLLDRATYAEQRNAELLTLMVSLSLLLKEHKLDGHPLADRIREATNPIKLQERDNEAGEKGS